MGIVSDLIATVRSTFRIKQATLDASGLTAPRTFTLPDTAGTLALVGGGGSGDVVGPASATDGAFAQFDLTTGKLLKNGRLVENGGLTALAYTSTDVDVEFALETSTRFAGAFGGGASSSYFALNSPDGTKTVELTQDDTESRIAAYGTPHVFYQDAAKLATLDLAGNFGLGCTPDSGAGQVFLQVGGVDNGGTAGAIDVVFATGAAAVSLASDADGGYIQCGNAAETGHCFLQSAAAANWLNSDGFDLVFTTDDSATELGRWKLDGTLVAPLAEFTTATISSAPTAADDVVNKAYADQLVANLSLKLEVAATSDAALPANTYANGVSGVGATLTGVATGVLTVDGYTTALNDRLLIKNEATAANNGIYKVTVAGAIGVAYVLTRTTDNDTDLEIRGGYTNALNGTANANKTFANNNTGAITVGTTALTYAQLFGAGTYTNGAGLDLSGNIFSIANDAVTYAKMQNVSATDKLLGRSTAGSGDVEEIACTAAGRALLDDADAAAQRATIGLSTDVIAFVVDGGGAAITTGVKGDITIPFACTITEWTILADQSGSIQFDIWKDTYANFPPVVGDTITASAKPLISAATKGQSSTLTGWTTSIAAGDILRFNVDSVATCQRVTLSLKVTR